jgi:hypothetical protein
MLELWGTTFTTERDKRAGPHATKQLRGRVSRVLQNELAGYLEERNR